MHGPSHTEPTEPRGGEQARPRVGLADAVTALRLPLAAGFVLAGDPLTRLALLAAAGASDLVDGAVARRVGGSRIGPVLDPICDRLFMAATFLVVAVEGGLAFVEVLGVLVRDIFTSAAFFAGLLRHRRGVVPAKASGKAVTLAQLLTLGAFLLRTPLVHPMAWLTTAIALYALYDYNRAVRALQARGRAGGT